MITRARKLARTLYWEVEQRRLTRTITERYTDAVVLSRRDQAVVRSTTDPCRARTGLFLYGACDLPALLSMAPLLAARHQGTTALLSRGDISSMRADFLLQTLCDLPVDTCAEISHRLRLPEGYFAPTLFEPTFEVPALDPEPFDKTVIFLSLGANVVRTLYQHDETGVLVDPGGWWLGTGPAKVTDEATLTWFRESFTSIGRLTPKSWTPLFTRVIAEIRSRMPAEIVVLNTLTVEPGTQIHNYGLRRNPEGARRREFHLCLADLAHELGFRVVDVDRILKREGVREQIDFAHFPTEKFATIAREGFDVLTDLGVVDSARRTA
jgi:hypothetical protein